LRRAASLLVLALAACGERAVAPATPPVAEFLVAAGDSTYWVRADAQGVRVRSAPLLLTRHAGRFHEIRLAEEITDFADAEFIRERLWGQPLAGVGGATADSVLLFADGAVVQAMASWQAAHPDETPIDPEAEDAPEPESSATDFVEVIDVHGRWVSWSHALDIDVAGIAADHVHRRRRGVADVVTGARATLESLVSPAEAARVRAAGHAAFDTIRAVVARADDDRAVRARATLPTLAFDDAAFSLTDSSGVPAVRFHVAGADGEGEAVELLLPAIALGETPAWWAEVSATIPAWTADSAALAWRQGATVVTGEVDAARTRLTLTLAADSAGATSWPIADVPMPAYQFIALDVATFDAPARRALTEAFDRASGDDPFATRAEHRAPTSDVPSRFRLTPTTAMSTRPARTVAESMHVSSELIMPQDANILGHVFGGAIMAMVDKAAAVAAFRHARTNCVTASIDRVDFKEPIHVGELVSCHASVNFVGTTSMEVGVRVEAEDLISGIRRHTNTCYLTFVAIDRNGRPVPIPQVIPETPAQERRYAAARERRRRRLEERQAEARGA
jgi:acyl-CoA hydrolase